MKEFVIDISRVRRLAAPRVSGRVGARLATAAIVVGLVWSALYQVGPDEIGVVRRFGRYVRASQSGSAWRPPAAGRESAPKPEACFSMCSFQ